MNLEFKGDNARWKKLLTITGRTEVIRINVLPRLYIRQSAKKI